MAVRLLRHVSRIMGSTARALAVGTLVLTAVVAVVLLSCLAVAWFSFEPLNTVRVEPLSEPPRSAGAEAVVPSPRYELLELEGTAAADDVILFMAFSGGGKRSSAFSYGVLEGMCELEGMADGGAPRRMIDMVDLVTGVSGGSFTAASYALRGEDMFEDYRDRFLYDATGWRLTEIFLYPWKWNWLISEEIDRSQVMAGIFDELLFDGATYADLSARGRPMLVLGATDVVLGTSFLFTQRAFDLLCGDLNPLPVSIAVAASNGFPGLFSPVSLNRHDKPCNNEEPDWLKPLSRYGSGGLGREAFVAEAYRRYLDAQIDYVHLMDGGIADNLALRGLVNAIILFNNIDGLSAQSEYIGVRHVLLMSVDGEASADLGRARERALSGIMDTFSYVSGTQIDRYNRETLLLGSLVLEEFQNQLIRLRCTVASMIDGHPCNAVTASFVHLSLNDIEDEEMRQRLTGIPTGLSLDSADVDALIEAGRASVSSSEDIRRFLERL